MIINKQAKISENDKLNNFDSSAIDLVNNVNCFCQLASPKKGKPKIRK